MILKSIIDLRDRFAWFMRYALVRDLPDIYEDYQSSEKVLYVFLSSAIS
mgnify:CR=1 FL=1